MNIIENYEEIEPSQYLLIVHLKSKNIVYSNKTFLKIIIEGDIKIKFLGLNSEPPSNINAESKNIKFERYNYGLETGKLFKLFKNIIKVMENEFGFKMHPEAKGFYIESIFKEEFETLVRYDKNKLALQVCS